MPRPALFRGPWLKAIGCLTGLCLAGSAVQAAETSEPQAASSAPNQFLILDEIDVPIVDTGRIEGILHVSFVIQARSPEAAQALAQRLPEIRSTALAHTIEFARLYASPFGAVNVGKLSQMVGIPVKKMDKRIAQVLIVKVSANTT